MNEKIHELTARLVREILPTIPKSVPLADVPLKIHAAIWPLVRDAVHAEIGEPDPVAMDDRRAKKWLYTVYFWKLERTGPDLAGETDPTIITGTGLLTTYLPRLAAQLHECPVDALDPAMQPDGIKAALPQLRNNLGRLGTGVLRINYLHGGAAYLCQADVVRAEA